MMQRTVTNLGLMEKEIVPPELIGVPPKDAMESLVRSVVRILLLLQAKPTTPRRHCLLGCWNPPVPAPRICDLAKRLGVQITRNGIRTAAVSILPPLRDFDPPMYVTVLNFPNPQNWLYLNSNWISISYDFCCTGCWSTWTCSLSRLCTKHQNKFKSLLYNFVLGAGGDSHMLCQETHNWRIHEHKLQTQEAVPWLYIHGAQIHIFVTCDECVFSIHQESVRNEMHGHDPFAKMTALGRRRCTCIFPTFSTEECHRYI